MRKFDFQSRLSKSIVQIFFIFFSLKNANLGVHFFMSLIFRLLYFLKWFPIFDSSLPLQFSKRNIFIWLQLILANNLSNFKSLSWKLHNRYCHIPRSIPNFAEFIYGELPRVSDFNFSIILPTGIFFIEIGFSSLFQFCNKRKSNFLL